MTILLGSIESQGSGSLAVVLIESLLLRIPGIAEVSALKILSDLSLERSTPRPQKSNFETDQEV